MRYGIITLALVVCAGAARADPPKTSPVPYRLTDTHHVLVRVKINGKGPFNFIVDTGCPVMLVAESVGKKVGLAADKRGNAVLDKLEVEGGLALDKVPAVVKTAFQIDGMNSMGLAGAELHGLMGASVLAKYRMTFDFTRPHLAWTPLAYDPPPPERMTGKVDTGGMDMMVSLVKVLTYFAGIKVQPEQPRGSFGLELAEANKQVTVAKVLEGSPAAKAGLQTGDKLVAVEGKAVATTREVLAAARKLTSGRPLRVTIERGDKKNKQDMTLTAGDGL